MAMHYSDKGRENDATSLPNVETFRGRVAECRECGEPYTLIDGTSALQAECHACHKTGVRVLDTKLVWFYWFCFPGCLPDSDWVGPFDTEAEALAAARDEDSDDDSDQ